MSLINQMLKDLEKRKSEAEPATPWPRGIQIVDEYPKIPRRWAWWIATGTVTAGLVVVAWWYLASIDNVSPAPVVAVVPSNSEPAVSSHAGVIENPLPLGEGLSASPSVPPISAEGSPRSLASGEKPAGVPNPPTSELPIPKSADKWAPQSLPVRKPDGGAPVLAQRRPERPASESPGGGGSAATLYRRGAQALDEGYVARAMSDLERVLVLEPNHREARVSLLKAYATYGDYERAGELLEGYPELRSDSTVARLQAQMLLKQGKTAQAEQALEQAGAPEADAESLGVRGALKQRQGKHGEAVELYRKAVTLQPGQAKWWLGMAISMEASERYEEAMPAYRRTQELGALSPEVRAYVTQRLASLRGQN